MDHQTLLHLVNKSVVTSRITRCFHDQEFDFKVIYKLGKVHFLPDHLSQISHGESPRGIEDQLLDISLFIVSIGMG